jgi:arylsulfatase A-like enzyme
LAADGLRLRNYTVEAQCTPTRSAILTGRLPVRSGTTSVPLPGQGNSGLASWEYTLAELFSDAGYATGAFGKWHLGEVAGRLPIDQGFDEWFGIKNSSDEAGYSSYPLFRELGYPVPQWWQGVRGQAVESAGVFDMQAKIHGDERIAERAVGFIDRQASAGRPFFAYVAFFHLHPPMGVHPDFAGESGGGLYADMLTEMDYRTGQILDAVKSAGVEDNTIMVFSSDNATSPLAGTGGGSNGPWRGDFFNPPYEGSYRVPAVVGWPGHIPAGRRSDQMLSAVDWLPTLAALTGQSQRVPTDPPHRRHQRRRAPAWQLRDVRPRLCAVLRHRRRIDVGEVEELQSDPALFRRHQRSHRQATDAHRLRPHQLPRRTVEPLGAVHGHGMGVHTRL